MRLALVIGLLCIVTIGNAQEYELEPSSLTVLGLSNADAGGINSGQFSEIDLNFDGLNDLVIFDRTSNKLSTYIASEGGYNYRQAYEYQFPDRLINWVLLRDYNCDGYQDIFTSTNLGIKVFKNLGATVDSLAWELVADPVITFGNAPINLFVNSTDLPAISDIDADGDLDILVFNFATGGFIEFHENRSMDKYGSCDSLEYVRVTREWGDFQECFCGSFAFGNEACDGSSRLQHISGKALTVQDLNDDSLPDILFGEEACGDVFQLDNEGQLDEALFTAAQVPFPELTNQLFFPAAYLIDINQDNQQDLILAPNDRDNELDLHDYQNSVYSYQNNGGAFEPLEEGFLQETMIDVGFHAYPAYGDVDEDGDNDLIIGNRGSNLTSEDPAKLHFYKNVGDGTSALYELITDDYLNLSQLGLAYIKPKIVDLNRDGLDELTFTAFDGQENNLYILQGQAGGYDLNNANIVDAPSNQLDQYALHDVNRDGNIDMLVGTSGGRLDLYHNTGTALTPNYELETQGYLGLTVNPFRTNLSIAIVDRYTSMDMITYDDSGEIRVIEDFTNNNLSDIIPIRGTTLATRLGRIGSLALGASGVINNRKLIVGSIQGGVFSFDLQAGALPEYPEDTWQTTLYPNPTDGLTNIRTSRASIASVISLSGQILIRDLILQEGRINTINLSNLSQGIYIFALTDGFGNTRQQKVIINE